MIIKFDKNGHIIKDGNPYIWGIHIDDYDEYLEWKKTEPEENFCKIQFHDEDVAEEIENEGDALLIYDPLTCQYVLHWRHGVTEKLIENLSRFLGIMNEP